MSEAGPLPERVTTPLLALITQQSLDEDYRHVAEQRATGLKGAVRRRPAVTVAALAAFALLVTVAGVQTSRDAGVRSEDRGQLIDRIDARRTAVSRLQTDLGRLRDSNVAADSAYQQMGQQLAQLTSRVTSLETETGFHVLTGPGVRASVDDSPGGTNEVRDSDLQLLVNGLWGAGARGVAVNGQRVTALSALRNSGQAIRINDVSLSPPYTVEAVGDTRTLQARFADSTSGIRFHDLTRQYGMPFTMDNVGSLSLPAAPSRMRAVHYARTESTSSQKKSQEDSP